MTRRIRVRFYGRVQGVFFRANTQKFARKLGISGWVKNLSDGSVEAVFEGNEEKVVEMLKFCKSSPGASRVDRVEVKEEPPRGEKEFRIIY